ncbi:MAG: nucleoside recognition domain-containing protein [Clostridiaceae bacterium]
MINYIWFFIIFIGIVVGILTGNGKTVSNIILDSGDYTVKLMMSLVGILCIWSGIIKIAEESRLNKKIAALLKPLLKILFKESSKDEKSIDNIALNLTANMLGLGNAATPLGIKAMESMEEINSNKEVLSNDMVLFLVLNAASVQFIPTTIISIRASLHSINPSNVILPIILISIISAILGITYTKILEKFF